MEEELMTCCICLKQLQSCYGYKEHMKCHLKDIPMLHCPGKHCDQMFTSKSDVLKHFNEDHPMDLMKLVKSFRNKEYLERLRLLEFVYINDINNLYNEINPLVQGNFCWDCFRVPRKSVHYCEIHEINLSMCFLCGECIGRTTFGVHILTGKCRRKKIIFSGSEFLILSW